MRPYKSWLFLLIAAVSAFAQTQNAKPVADRLAAQNALFDEYYENELRNFPERATAVGECDAQFRESLKDAAENH